MNLEDHLGDIIRKARGMSKVSPETAARAAGATVEDLEKLEESGRTDKKLNYVALAQAIGLDGPKLEAIAKGWLPSEKDTSTWREFRCFSSEGNGMAVNNYLIWDEVSREAALFDTGWYAQPVEKLITENQVQLRHIFITHTHEDHIAALADVRKAFPKARLHSSSKNAAVDQRNRANDFIHLGSLRITNRDTPGHAEDGITYIIGTWPEDAPHVAIVGDTIFSGSMGTGFQSWDLAKQKIRDQIFTLPPDTLLCAGHGPFTTVAEEKAHNPFFV